MRRRFLAALLPLLLQAPAGAAPVCVDPERPELNHPVREGPTGGGIGGTGHQSGKGGIGGTGLAPGEGGIGGTGAPLADATAVGIVGVISGFASVCVNGVEVHFDNAVPVSDNGEPSAAGKLAVGQVVSIEAGPSPRGLEAKNIAILHALEGPVTDIHPGGKMIHVMGQPVALGPNTRLAGSPLAPGQHVKVSALSGANGKLFATRIQTAKLEQASLLGTVMHSGNGASVNGVHVGAPLSADAAIVKGKWTGSTLLPSSIKPDPSARLKENVGRLLIEGLVQDRSNAENLTVAGMRVNTAQLPRDVVRSVQTNQRIFIDASVDRSGRLVARLI